MKKSASSRSAGDQSSYQSSLLRAAGLCSRQEQCTSHIREKLRDWDVGEADIEKIIQELTEEKYLDDRRYASFFAKDKFRLNGWGNIKISHMLRLKKIQEEAIQEALSQIEPGTYFEACVNLLRSKDATLKENNQFARKGKLFRFASGRGFEPDVIHRALHLIEKH